MTVVIRGAGDLASGIALRLHRAGYKIVMTEQPKPLAVRWTVSFCSAVLEKEASVEGVRARLVDSPEEAARSLEAEPEVIPVLVDPELRCLDVLHPAALIDAILAKKNRGITRDLAPVVIGVGPGFSAPQDCHAVIETMRGHTLGRAIYEGEPIPNTGVPGSVGGYTLERLLRAPADGIFHPLATIGDEVEAGQTVAEVDGVPMKAEISGILRGLLQPGLPVWKGLKAGDVDPRCRRFHCYTVSDKALSIGGGALEALLHFGVLPD